METMLGLALPDVERWSDHVVVVRGLNPGPFTGPGTNTYLIGRGRRPLLLDTGAGQAGYVPLLDGALEEHCRTDAPGDILITHVHPDHLGGAPDVLKRFGPRPVGKMPWPGRDERIPVQITPIAEGETFRTEGATLRAIHTPGHARDHLCFYLEEERALFTGDVVLGVGTSVIPLDGGDLGDYLQSLERLLTLDLDRIYPGHGPMIVQPQEKLREYMDHRLEREHQVLDAIRTGSETVDQMVEQIYAEYPRALFPAAAQSVKSHLLKLERERRAFRGLDAAGAERWSLA
jgi:glyoxylase-like metal-dependent hydrolase (beta-lactamase superfamily II)